MGQWIFGGIMGLLALFGLALASRAHDAMFAFFGYMLFLFGIAVIFGLIHRATAEPPEEAEAGGEESPSRS